MFNSFSVERLSQVCPLLAKSIAKIDLALPSLSIQVTEGVRTWEQQDIDYAQGRTTAGKIITHAPGGFSWHQYGLAVDLVPEDITPGQPDWNLDHPAWARMVSVAESLGLVSGAEWHGEDLDTPHVQLTGRFGVVPDDEVRAIFKQSGGLLTAVWGAAFDTQGIT
jgi:peptidoglycan L-alanyl-D-glutamate endopeptidase CwlK